MLSMTSYAYMLSTTAYYDGVRTPSTCACVRTRQWQHYWTIVAHVKGARRRIMIWFDAWFRQERLDVHYVTADCLLTGWPLLSDNPCLHERRFSSERGQVWHSAVLSHPVPTHHVRPSVESLSMNPCKLVKPSTTERQSSRCSNLTP